ncbi:MAG TPA: GNAT family N-acetyltransferase [Mucilaginibacter sp.]|jgi:ribosomal-protein-alanine N-acetyltransferase
MVREFDPEEEVLLINLYRDERVTLNISESTDEETKQKFTEALKSYRSGSGLGRWGIFNPEDGKFIGVCSLKQADADHKRIELGYVLHPDYWGRGLATELAKALVFYGFQDRGLTEICASTLPENYNSQNVLLKAGFVRDGTAFWHGADLPFFKIKKRRSF